MALGSSVVNKSSKKLAPKAPAQRRRPGDGPSQPAGNEPVKQVPEVRASAAPEAASTSATKNVTPAPSNLAVPPAPAERAQNDIDEIDSNRPNKRRRIDQDEVTNASTVETSEATPSRRQSVPLEVPVAKATAVVNEPQTSAGAPEAFSTSTDNVKRANTSGYLPTPESTQNERPARAPSVPTSDHASFDRAISQRPRDDSNDLSPRAPVAGETPTPQISTGATTSTTNVVANHATTPVPQTPRTFQTKLAQSTVPPNSTPKATVTELAKQKARADRAKGMISPEASQATQAHGDDMDEELPPIGFAPAVPRPAGSPTIEDAEALLALRNANTNGFSNAEQTNAQSSTSATTDVAPHNVSAASKPKKPRQKKVSKANQKQDGEGSSLQPTPAKKPRAPRQKKVALSAERVTEDGDDVDVNGTSADIPAQSTEGAAQSIAPAKAKKPRKPRKRPETSEDDPQAAGAAPKTRKPRKPRASAATSQTDGNITQQDGEPPIDPALLRGDDTESQDITEAAQDRGNQDEDEDDTPATGRRGRKPRSPTPSDAEDVEIDTTAVSMMDLTVDMRQGKVSKRERAMREINWVEVAARRREAEAEAKAKAIAGEQPGAEDEDDRQREAEEEARRRENGPSRGPQLKLVNGVMVLDTDSLVMDNRNRLDDNSNAVEEETDLTKKITSHSWLYDNRRAPEERFASTMKSDPWSSDQTDAFYDALRMFGTDFFIISKMFPGKTRRHIKLKFVREERADPERVKAALIGEVKEMDMSVYCEATGLDEDHFKNPEELEEELRQAQEAQKEEIEQAKADAVKKAEDKQNAAKEKSTRAKRGKKKQNTDVEDPEIIIG